MKKSPDAASKEYWQKNIAGFAGFYEDKSTEEFSAVWPVRLFYRAAILPVEKKYMHRRFTLVAGFIADNVTPTMTVADIGCGNGIFTRLLANRAKKVYAIDFAEKALDLTARSLTQEQKTKVDLIQMDITQRSIPQVDAAIAIGVLPYVSGPALFFQNTLPFTGRLLFNFLDAENPANRLRRMARFLDVRYYTYNKKSEIGSFISNYGFRINRSYPLATGRVMDIAKIGV